MSVTVVQQSLCIRCAVCEGQGRVELVAWEDHVSTTHTTVNCPHCSNWSAPIPYLELPLRRDLPWAGGVA